MEVTDLGEEAISFQFARKSPLVESSGSVEPASPIDLRTSLEQRVCVLHSQIVFGINCFTLHRFSRTSIGTYGGSTSKRQ